jgi:hypothetical protein
MEGSQIGKGALSRGASKSHEVRYYDFRKPALHRGGFMRDVLCSFHYPIGGECIRVMSRPWTLSIQPNF